MADNDYIGKWLTPDKNIYYFLIETKRSIKHYNSMYDVAGFEIYINASKKWINFFNYKRSHSQMNKSALDKMWIEDGEKTIMKLQRRLLRFLF